MNKKTNPAVWSGDLMQHISHTKVISVFCFLVLKKKKNEKKSLSLDFISYFSLTLKKNKKLLMLLNVLERIVYKHPKTTFFLSSSFTDV